MGGGSSLEVLRHGALEHLWIDCIFKVMLIYLVDRIKSEAICCHRRDWSNPPPWLLFKVGIWLLALLKRFMKAIQPPPLTLFDIQMGAWQTQVSLCVATHYQRAPLAESDGLSLHCTEHLKDEGFCKQVLYAVAALGIADVLGSKGPQTAEELADTLGIVPSLSAPAAAPTYCGFVLLDAQNWRGEHIKMP